MWPITAETAVIITVPRCTRGSSSDLSIPEHLKQTRIQYSHGPPGAFLLTQTYAKQKVLPSFLQSTHGLFSSHRRNIASPEIFSICSLRKKINNLWHRGNTCCKKGSLAQELWLCWAFGFDQHNFLPFHFSQVASISVPNLCETPAYTWSRA